MKKAAKKENWLFESSEIPFDTSSIRVGLKVKKKIYSGRSPYQKFGVFDTIAFGKILVLDGIFQTSERDEYIYHEMMNHVPMFYHDNPKKVLIIGGGDGGSLEEVLKHPIERVWMVEIDKKVIDVSKKYLPSISKAAFKSKKAEIIVGDGLKFIESYKNKHYFDVIVLDLSDPHGPAQKLISSGFYKDVKTALKKGGVIAVQSGSLTVQPKLTALIYSRLKRVFSSVMVHHACVPLYQAGEFSFTMASDRSLKDADFRMIEKRFNKLNLQTKYYSPLIHFSSRALPKVFKDLLGIKKK